MKNKNTIDMCLWNSLKIFADTSVLKVIKDLDNFKNVSDIIVANRFDEEIIDVDDKVYTRDI